MNIQVTVDDDNCKVIKATQRDKTLSLKKYPNGMYKVMYDISNNHRLKHAEDFIKTRDEFYDFVLEHKTPSRLNRIIFDKL